MQTVFEVILVIKSKFCDRGSFSISFLVSINRFSRGTFAIKRLLDEPFENEVTLREQNQSWKSASFLNSWYILGRDLDLSIQVQWCQIENQQSPVYPINSYFIRHPDGCLECCHNVVLLNHLYNIWELSNEVLYDPLHKGASKIRQVKVKIPKLT